MTSIMEDPDYERSFIETEDGRCFSIEKYNQLKATQQAPKTKRSLPEGAVRREFFDRMSEAERSEHIRAGGWVED